ncbi:CHAT domain-containing protein [Dokdonella soli]
MAVTLRDAGAAVMLRDVSKNTPLHDAGLGPGDRVDAFTQDAGPHHSAGEISNPFDLALLMVENVGRGAVLLRGRHDGAAANWTLGTRPDTGWTFEAALPLDRSARASFDGAMSDIGHGKAGEAERKVVASTVAELEQRHLGPWAAWAAFEAARQAAAGKQADLAAEWRAASLKYTPTAAARERMVLHVAYAKSFASRGEWEAAFDTLKAALVDLDAQGQAHTLAAAYTHYLLGAMRSRRGQSEAAMAELAQADALYAELAPTFWERAITAIEQGALTNQQRDREASVGHYERAIAVFKAGDPNGHWVLDAMTALAIVETHRGNLTRARRLIEEATPLLASMPDGQLKPLVLINFAQIEADHGDHAAAERHLREAIDVATRFPRQDGLPNAAFCALGVELRTRGELEPALHMLEACDKEHQAVARDNPWSIDALLNQAQIERELGRLDAATVHAQSALEMERQINKGKPYSAGPLQELAVAELDRAHPDKAATLLAQAREIIVRTHTEGDEDDGELAALDGRLRLARHDNAGAEASLRRALQITALRSPGSLAEAAAHHQLGLVLRADGRRDDALTEFCAGAASLERQIGRIGGGGDERARFVASTRAITRDCAEAQIAAGHVADAFLTAERGRARGLLRLLAERHLDFADDAHPDLLAERRRVDASYDEAAAELAGLPESGSKQRSAALTEQLAQLRERRADLNRRLRELSPRLAVVTDPQPLDATTSARALDPGSVLISYLLGPERGWAFVLPAGSGSGLRAFPIPLGEAALRERVNRLRNAIAAHDPGQLADLERQARALYVLLLQPAERELVHADRALIASDGPLALLPFAALRRGSGADAQYVVAWKPLTQVASATVFAEGRAARTTRARVDTAVAAFGDPRYAGADTMLLADARTRRIDPRRIVPLPATRREVEALPALFPRTRLFLGSEATENAVRRAAPQANILHIAAHGYFDDRVPLDSGLLLSTPAVAAPGEDNGFLQVWEIFEGVRTSADLVALSACDTALGEEVAGEGLLGLIRAFEFAGAHAVMASLWNVSDDSTATLMQDFYAALASGADKDAALRSAQLALLAPGATADGGGTRGVRVVDTASPGVTRATTHPYYWAGFQLYGDAR